MKIQNDEITSTVSGAYTASATFFLRLLRTGINRNYTTGLKHLASNRSG
ncbi:MAG: hypothetical protein ABW007_22645 [Chitinophagaceae bacterium]